MLQPAAICRNKVQAKLHVEIESLFYVVTLLKKNEKKIVATILNSVTTMIKENSKRAELR